MQDEKLIELIRELNLEISKAFGIPEEYFDKNPRAMTCGEAALKTVRKYPWLVDEVCPECKGSGKSICNNPDHGFIDAVGGEIGRLGCPCCGHDPNYLCKCDTCSGHGIIAKQERVG